MPKQYAATYPTMPPVGTKLIDNDGTEWTVGIDWNPEIWVEYLRAYGPLVEAPRDPRTWAVPAEPEVGTKVRDEGGDVWTRNGYGWTLNDNSYGNSWEDVLSYAPLIEIFED